MNVAIIGASGYSGAELAGLLLKHPGVRLNTLMTANQERQDAKPRKYSEELPQFSGRCDLEIEPLDLDALVQRRTRAVFLATPNETSHDLVPQLLERQLRVIDLSGAYRLKQPDLYPKWYGFEHHFAPTLKTAVYGLTEIHRPSIRQASLLANPGCYPTSALLPLIPLQRAGLIDDTFDIICDSKSGVSGAGKVPNGWHSLFRGYGELQGLQRVQAPACTGDLAGAEFAAARVYTAPAAHQSRHSFDHLCPSAGIRDRRDGQ